VTALAPQSENALARYATFEHVVELIASNRDGLLLNNVKKYVRLASYQPGRIEFVPAPGAPQDLAQRLGGALQRWTGNRWAVILVNDGGQPSIFEVEDAAAEALREEALAHPLVQTIFDAFPKAKITEIKSQQDIANEAMAEALPEVEDEWDPFEED
jgi:DNA polymerase-3 subunit gamma/tau